MSGTTHPSARCAHGHLRRAQIVALSLAAALCLFRCGPSSNNNSQSTNTPPQAAVDLTPGQLGSIKIGAATLYPFAVEKEAVGTVSFTDDPNLIQAESNLLTASSAYVAAQKELARVRSLGTANGIAQKDLEQAVATEVAAEAAYVAAHDALHYLGKTDAEIDRMVAANKIETHKAPSLTGKWVSASVVETDAPFVQLGQPVTVRVLAFPDEVFKGTVMASYSAIDPNAHRMTVRALVNDARNELRGGMVAEIVIEVQAPQASIGLPENAVVREGDGTMTVWVTSDRRRYLQRVVKTGLREGGRVQILQGMRPGETVVTDGAIFLDNLLQAPPSD